MLRRLFVVDEERCTYCPSSSHTRSLAAWFLIMWVMSETQHLRTVTEINVKTAIMLKTVGYPACFSSQNKPLSLEETGTLGPTNPLQRVPPHKECQKVLTPPELSANPPGYDQHPRV